MLGNSALPISRRRVLAVIGAGVVAAMNWNASAAPAGALGLNEYQRDFLLTLAHNRTRFVVIGREPREDNTTTNDLVLWADFRDPHREALFEALRDWHQRYPLFDQEGGKVMRPEVRLYNPDDTMLRAHGIDPNVGGVDILTRIGAESFDEFLARSGSRAIHGQPVRYLSPDDLETLNTRFYA